MRARRALRVRAVLAAFLFLLFNWLLFSWLWFNLCSFLYVSITRSAMCQWSNRTIFTDVINTNAKSPDRGCPEVLRAPQSKSSIKMLQAKIVDACSLTQIVILIPVRIQELEAVSPNPFWPYQVDCFVRVIETISKHVPTSPFFLITQRNTRNIVTSFISQSCNLLVEVFFCPGCSLSWVE